MAIVYINADTGSDSNTYAQAQSSSTPWLTPTKVLSAAADGDTCIVQTSTAAFTCAASASIAKNITFTGATTTPANHVFNFTGRWTIGTASKTIAFNYIKFTSDGTQTVMILASATSSAFAFSNCYISADCTASTNLGMFCGSGTTVSMSFTNTLITGLTTSATKNLFCETGGYAFSVSLTGCTIYTPALETIFKAVNGSIPKIIKNTIVYATSSTPYSSGGGSSTATYSCFYNISSSPAGTGNITSDPLMVDPANNNFNLRPTSPCIDTGTLV